MATTPSNGLPYPDDYSDPADTPAAIEALALATDTALNARALNTRQIIAGSGLTGGGNLQSDRTLNVGAGTGVTVAADTVALDKTYTDGLYPPKTRRINTTAPLTGGGDLSADRTLSITAGYYARVYVQATQPTAGNVGDIWVPT